MIWGGGGKRVSLDFSPPPPPPQVEEAGKICVPVEKFVDGPLLSSFLSGGVLGDALPPESAFAHSFPAKSTARGIS